MTSKRTKERMDKQTNKLMQYLRIKRGNENGDMCSEIRIVIHLAAA